MDNFVTYCSINKYHNLYTRASGNIVVFTLPCIGYILSGEAEFLHDGKTFSASEGDLIYIAPETKYYSLWTGYPDIEFYSFNFNLTNISVFMNYRFQILKNFPSELLDNVYNTRNSDFFEMMSHFNALLSEIYKRAEQSTYNSSYKLIKPAIDYIEKNFDKKIKINELAALCNYSDSYFYNLFKEATGVSPIVYKQNITIQHAFRYLSETTLSIEQISEKLGFTSPNYFRTVLKKYTQKTPRDIRK